MLEIPCSHAGVVKEIKVALGDKVSEGSLLLMLEATDAPADHEFKPNQAVAPVASAQAATKTVASTANAAGAAGAAVAAAGNFTGSVDLDCDLLVLGGGPGGYSAAFRAADLRLKVILVERYAQLGGAKRGQMRLIAFITDRAEVRQDFGAYRCGLGAPAHIASARAGAVGRM